MDKETLNFINTLINKHCEEALNLDCDNITDLYSLSNKEVSSMGMYHILSELLEALGED
jgi:hypothetical protein